MDKDRIRSLQQRLPQWPGILGREKYHSSAILVPLVTINGEEQLLFEKRAPHIKQGSEICFPGGHFDEKLDRSSIDTALRETKEELGVEEASIELVGQLDTLVSPRGLIVECFLGYIDITTIDQLRLDRDEVDEVFCVPVKWFQENPPEIYGMRVEIQSSYTTSEGTEKILLPVEKLGLPSHYAENRSEWISPVAVYRREPDIIWGLTAAVVKSVIGEVFPVCPMGTEPV